MKIKRTAKDAAFTQAIKARDGYKCRCCGTKYAPTSLKKKCALGVMHFFGRRDPGLRHNADNALTGCMACHNWLGANPYWAFRLWLRELGPIGMDGLILAASTMYGRPKKAVKMDSMRFFPMTPYERKDK